MDDTKRDLRAYYEAEARLRARGPLSPPREALVRDFIDLLHAEGRSSVVDVGAGPGGDGERFVADRLSYVGVDLAFGNAQLAAERGLVVVQADVAALPFHPASFAAGWSMSTLMHLPEAQVPAAARQITSVLERGAPLLVGLWGGDLGDVISERGVEGCRRLFSLRTFERNTELLEASGARVEWSTTWEFGPDEWTYHVFRLRVGD